MDRGFYNRLRRFSDAWRHCNKTASGKKHLDDVNMDGSKKGVPQNGWLRSKCETQHFWHLLLSYPLTWRFFLERSPPFQNVLGIPMPNRSTTTTTTNGTLMVESELLTFVIKLLTPVVKVSTSSFAHVKKLDVFLCDKGFLFASPSLTDSTTT